MSHYTWLLDYQQLFHSNALQEATFCIADDIRVALFHVIETFHTYQRVTTEQEDTFIRSILECFTGKSERILHRKPYYQFANRQVMISTIVSSEEILDEYILEINKPTYTYARWLTIEEQRMLVAKTANTLLQLISEKQNQIIIK